MKKIDFIIVVVFIVSIVLIFAASCELLNGSADPEYLDKLHEEIAWANAPRLNITVAFPESWGTSFQHGVGRAGDTRVGYAFDIGFTPAPEYAFLGWHAYDTDELNRLYPNWINQANAITQDKVIHSLRNMPRLEGIDLPQFGLGGGEGKVEVSSSDVLNITLIPVSNEQPRIIRSTPNSSTEDYIKTGTITIVFAASINPNTVNFGTNLIEIFSQKYDPETGDTIGSSTAIHGDRYDTFSHHGGGSSKYDDTNRTITIYPKDGGPDEDSIITLRLGERITNHDGRRLEPVEIKWKTIEGKISVVNPLATYDESSDSIIVEWSSEGSFAEAEVTWFINGDYGLPFSEKIASGYEFNIPDVPVLAPGNIDSLKIYEITITLYNADDVPFEMDGEPLMVINAAGSASEGGARYTLVRNADDLIAVQGNGMFLLMNDISVSNWTPLGHNTPNAPFTGTFYGFEKKITVNSFASNLGNNTSYGLFSRINNSKIYNLNIDYNNTNVNLANTVTSVTAGGIAGTLNGTNIIQDCSYSNGYMVNGFRTSGISYYLLVNDVRHGVAFEGYKLDSATTTINIRRTITTKSAYRVHLFSDTGEAGTLRHALNNAPTDADIILEGVTPGETTINLIGRLTLPNNRIFTIEGNGIVITRSTSWTAIWNDTQLLYVNNLANLTINRVHFRNGRSSNSGSAIQNHGGTVTLNSCIFSGNITNGDNFHGTHGGAIRNEDGATMTVIGCTFYNNIVRGSTDNIGAAIYNSGTLTIAGNIFYANNSYSNDHHVIWGSTYKSSYADRTLTTLGYNIVDRNHTDARWGAGYPLHTNDEDLPGVGFSDATGDRDGGKSNHSGDKMVPGDPPIDITTFAPITTTGTMYNHIPASWASTNNNMPAVDFYGNPRRHTFSGDAANRAGAPGAVERP